MRLLQLTLRNFKGIKDFTLDTRGENVNIYADNELGKTSIFDAFLWLLFNKDSQGQSQFEIKTLDEKNEPVHGLDHEVEGVFEIGGAQLTLKKVFREKWVKQRGKARAEFSGHETKHFIDGVPVKKSQYDSKISEITREDVFRLLTSPLYFNTQLKWEQRRELLLDVCGDVSDEEVITSNEALAELPEILQGRTSEDHKKVIASRKAEVNDELKKIPVRIDEINHNLPDITGISPDQLTSDLSELKTRLQEKQNELSRVEAGGEVAEKTKQLRELESELLEIKNRHQQEADAGAEEKRAALAQLRDEIGDLQHSIRSKKLEIEGNEKVISRLEETAKNLRLRWHQVNDQEFTFEQSDICPTCGQSLPEAQLKEAREKALAEFNRQKAENLEAITAEGKSVKAEADELKDENTRLEKEIQEAEKQLGELQQKVDALQAELDALAGSNPDISENEAYMQKLKEKSDLETAIENLKAGNQDAVARIQDEIEQINLDIAVLEEAQGKVKQHQDAQARIEELKKREQQLAQEYEKLEYELYLTDLFTKTKVKMLDERINNRFQLARFKMFKEQINGGVEPCCEVLYRGVPFSSMNNAARIQVGLDIINTLSEYYGFKAPVFIDNRESVVRLPETDCQVISLIVSKGDKQLRVEHVPAESGAQKEAM